MATAITVACDNTAHAGHELNIFMTRHQLNETKTSTNEDEISPGTVLPQATPPSPAIAPPSGNSSPATSSVPPTSDQPPKPSSLSICPSRSLKSSTTLTQAAARAAAAVTTTTTTTMKKTAAGQEKPKGFAPPPPKTAATTKRLVKPVTVQAVRRPAAGIIANLALSPRQPRKLTQEKEEKKLIEATIAKKKGQESEEELGNTNTALLPQGTARSPPPPPAAPSTDEEATIGVDGEKAPSSSPSQSPLSGNSSSAGFKTRDGGEKPRIQTIIMRKKRQTECFADAQMVNKQGGGEDQTARSKSTTRSSERTVILSDPQKAEVSATVSLGRAAKLQRELGAVYGNSHPILLQAQSFAAPATPAPFKALKAPTNIDEGLLKTKICERKSDNGTEHKGLGNAEMHMASLANKLSRSFFDLTAGSSDRLQRWKSKLGRKNHRDKDTSEPPPLHRHSTTGSGKMPAALLGASSNADGEILVDWSRGGIRHQPRQLHASRSMGNALLEPSLSVDSIATAIENAELGEMEHRTLKQRQQENNKDFNMYHNVKNLQQLVRTIEGISGTPPGKDRELPPPARITPYSGVKPQDSDIVRPIAFRPLVLTRKDERQSITSTASFTNPQQQRQTSFGIENGNSAGGGFMQRNNGFASQQCLANECNQRIASGPKPFVPPPTGFTARPKPIYQPSTSESSAFSSRQTTIGNDENDYDVVPEFIDGDCKTYSADEMSPHQPCQRNLPGKQLSQSSSNICPPMMMNNTNSSSSNNSNSSTSSQPKVKKSPSSNSQHNNTHTNQYATNGSNSSRHSSGIHVTPSPSDSGIVDYESIIRDKENELASVRSTMEQNEEIIVRVYQEKERQWREQLAEVRQRLTQSQHAEAAIRQQAQRMQEQRDQLACTVQNLNADKAGLQRKCLQIEREMFAMRERLDVMTRERLHGLCEQCQCDFGSRSSGLNQGNKAVPVPAPRQSKEPSADRELRSEVEQLRHEISTVRESLSTQIGLFADERQRWETEKAKITDQLLHGNPSKMSNGAASSSESHNNNNNKEMNNGLDEYAHLNSKRKNIIVSRDRLI